MPTLNKRTNKTEKLYYQLFFSCRKCPVGVS